MTWMMTTTMSRTASYCSVIGNQPPSACGLRMPPGPKRSLSLLHPRFLSAWSIHWWGTMPKARNITPNA